ncbi:MAG: endolytic transglycosylase MltG [Bdellovibrionaceae bacterium]|nr:endolytic transglycosylase MltG [Pseudobdellovibrionaceae bacterium]MBX3034128.1 endolytic transglycosylase MltG [Pseudobdellovibrionaceae bacterium]
MRKAVSTIILSAVVLGFCAAAVIGYVFWDFLASPTSAENREVVYEVQPGRGFNSIARDLEAAGVIRNSGLFSFYARAIGQRSKLKVGEYLLNSNMKPIDVLSVITSGHSLARPFTVSEGLNIFEIASLYERGGFGTSQNFLKVVRDPAFVRDLLGIDAVSLEGYLFPETYQITKFTTTKELVASMVNRFLSNYQAVENAVPAGMDRHQVVTLASIIEKETGAPVERPLISSVFHNRMAKGMRLQTDPTIIYGMAVATGKIPTNITKADLSRPTPYNTYVIPGLPPGPIANPGLHALQAAVRPEASPYFFFVSRNDGTHVFSATYEDHAKAVRSFQMNPRARAGKSWRDLQTKQKKTAAP